VGRWRFRNIQHVSLRLLALAMAVALWLVATGSPQQNLVLDRRTVRVEAAFERIPDALEVTSEPQVIEITVEGPRMVLPFQADDVEAFVDLQGLDAGRHRVPVQVRMPAGIGHGGINPREVTVVLEPRVERAVDVRVAVVGVPTGWSVRVLDVKPSAVDVYGAQSEVARVAYILAQTAYQPGMAVVASVQASAEPVDEHGRPVESVATSTRTIEIAYVIEESEPGIPALGSDVSLGR